MKTRPIEERFWEKVDKRGPDECWPWMGNRGNGYGCLEIDGKNRRAHRIAFEWKRGPIPAGLVLDHLCRNRACVNPNHLEIVDMRTNILRGIGPTALNVVKTHCKRGHELTEENVYRVKTWRECRVCLRMRSREYAKRAGPRKLRPRKPTTHEEGK